MHIGLLSPQRLWFLCGEENGFLIPTFESTSSIQTPVFSMMYSA